MERLYQLMSSIGKLTNLIKYDCYDYLSPGNVERYAVSVIWEIHPTTYKVRKVWYGRTLIKSSYKLCYEDAQGNNFTNLLQYEQSQDWS